MTFIPDLMPKYPRRVLLDAHNLSLRRWEDLPTTRDGSSDTCRLPGYLCTIAQYKVWRFGLLKYMLCAG